MRVFLWLISVVAALVLKNPGCPPCPCEGEQPAVNPSPLYASYGCPACPCVGEHFILPSGPSHFIATGQELNTKLEMASHLTALAADEFAKYERKRAVVNSQAAVPYVEKVAPAIEKVNDAIDEAAEEHIKSEMVKIRCAHLGEGPGCANMKEALAAGATPLVSSEGIAPY